MIFSNLIVCSKNVNLLTDPVKTINYIADCFPCTRNYHLSVPKRKFVVPCLIKECFYLRNEKKY